MLLETRDLTLGWQGGILLRHVDLHLHSGEGLWLSGPNGAGKSTLMRALAGLERVVSGRILWDGQDITDLPGHRRDGIALVPEGRLLAPSLTVAETLRLGAGRINRKAFDQRLCAVLDRLPVIGGRLDQAAGTLSGGEAQMLSLGRALMSAPRLLLLDEPTLGLSPAAAAMILASLKALKADGLAILICDQEVRGAAALADHLIDIADQRLQTVRSLAKETQS
jgi:branched-chain amino acid transport system ATP-binding protein